MKVVMINSVCGYGSTGRICTGIQSVLKEYGDDSIIFYGRGQAPQKYKSYKIGSNFNVFLHGLLSRVTDRHGLYSHFATKKLIKKIEEYSPDIIHLHNIHGYFVNYKLLFEFLARYKKPVVWTLHDCWSFTGHCAHFYNNNCEKWENGCDKCRFKNVYPKSLFSQSGKNFSIKKRLFTGVESLTLVSPSEWLSSLAKKSFLSDCDIMVINNGIDLSGFKPITSDFRTKYGIGDKKIILGVSNAWGHLKGLDTFNRLSRELGDDYKIVLVGVSAETDKGLSENIIKIKKTADITELAKIYSAADIFLNPTLQDNFPTVNIEALACGTPVISYDSGGSSEMLNKDTSIVIGRGDYDGLKKAILSFNAQKFSSVSCVESAKNYDEILKFRQYRELYDELSKKKRRTTRQNN